MPNIGAILRDEISRICRRDTRRQIQPIRKASAGYRREIAALKRQLQELQRKTGALARQAERSGQASAQAVVAEPPQRFVAKGLRSLRTRLGLSAPDLGRLVGVSDQTIYNWELKRTAPRKSQLAALAALRSIGKRE